MHATTRDVLCLAAAEGGAGERCSAYASLFTIRYSSGPRTLCTFLDRPRFDTNNAAGRVPRVQITAKRIATAALLLKAGGRQVVQASERRVTFWLRS